ncbi:MAG TPA: hypothetical protein VGK78_14670 [Nocardioides sp.]
MSPGRRERPAGNQALSDVSLDGDTASMPACASCCGELGLTDIAECSRRGIYCAPDTCAYRTLLRRQLERRADAVMRVAELRARAREYDAVAAFDAHAAWLRAQLLDFADLLEAGEA